MSLNNLSKKSIGKLPLHIGDGNYSGKYPKATDFIETGIPFISASDFSEGRIKSDNFRFISEQQHETLLKGQTKFGDVLVVTRGNGVGNVAWVDEEFNNCNLNAQLALLRSDEKEIHNKFLYYLLSSPKYKEILISYSSGSAQPQLPIRALKLIELSFPEYDKQKSIAKILSDLDDKIHLNNQINQTLESIAQAIFKSWFIDFEPVRAKIAAKQEGKDSELAAMCAISGKSEAELEQMAADDFAELQATAALFPDELVESELGEVPKGWDKYSLSKMITLIGGGTPKRSEPNYWNGDIFWFSVKDVPNEGEVFVITTQEKISELGLNKSSTKLLPVGTTIITARGTVGKIALVGYEMAMNQSCYGVQGINGVRQFMTYYLIKNAVEVLKKNTHGAVFDTITQSTFDTVTSIKPSIEMMDLFESKVEKIMGHIKNNLYENNSLIALRDTLLPKLLSGELDVSGVQDEVA